MKRRIVGIVAAVFLAMVGTFVLVAYVKGAEDRALAGERTVDVLVARTEIAKGTKAEDIAASVELEQLPAKVEAAGSVDSLDQLAGKVASVDLVAGEQILASRFVDPNAFAAQGDIEIPDGLHRVTIPLDPARTVGGQVRPGDTVGVVASFTGASSGDSSDEAPEGGSSSGGETTHLMLHKVLVTNVQAEAAAAQPASTDGDEPAPQPAPAGNFLVTLAVDAPTVERLVFAAEYGTVWLSAEPDNAPEDGTRIQSKETIYE